MQVKSDSDASSGELLRRCLIHSVQRVGEIVERVCAIDRSAKRNISSEEEEATSSIHFWHNTRCSAQSSVFCFVSAITEKKRTYFTGVGLLSTVFLSSICQPLHHKLTNRATFHSQSITLRAFFATFSHSILKIILPDMRIFCMPRISEYVGSAGGCAWIVSMFQGIYL